MRKITFLVIFYLLATTCFGQDFRCAAMPSNVVIRDFRLGMTESDAVRRYPKMKPFLRNPNDDEVSVVFIDTPSLEMEEIFTEVERKGLNSVKLTFLDKTLERFEITYDGFTEWDSVSEFTDIISKQLKLPIAAKWQKVDKNTLRLDCDNFHIISFVEQKIDTLDLRRPRLFFSMNDFDSKLAEKEKTKKDRKKKTFKP